MNSGSKYIDSLAWLTSSYATNPTLPLNSGLQHMLTDAEVGDVAGINGVEVSVA